jgi:hypothetical protein
MCSGRTLATLEHDERIAIFRSMHRLQDGQAASLHLRLESRIVDRREQK